MSNLRCGKEFRIQEGKIRGLWKGVVISMKRSTRNICIISGVLLGLIVLYLAGAAILSAMALEYRFWVDGLGKCLCILALPLWGIGVVIWKLWQCFREHTVGKWLVRLFGGVAALFCLAWCYFGTLLSIFLAGEDHDLGDGLVSVVTESFPGPVSYALYESVGPFFRRKTSLTPERVADYLTDRYKRVFYPIEENGETLYVDAGREVIRIAVEYVNGNLCEDYPQALADHYLAEGCQALELEWNSCILETEEGEEHFCLVLDDKENVTAFGEDVYRLMQYVLEQEPILKKYDVYIYLSAKEYKGQWAREGFGRSRSWENLSTRHYKYDHAKVIQSVKWAVDSMRMRAHQASGPARADIEKLAVAGARTVTSSDILKTVQASSPSPEPEPTEREPVETEYPEQCRAAEAIWEAELKDFGYDYEPGANAKGNLVIWLGKLPADNLQSDSSESDYYLTYDRESQNGNCYLFVLSEVPEGYGLNDAYLREFYACEKDTLKVVAGNKTSWAQTGCAEYREITGE